MKRVALYVRVSTQEQKNHGLSVDSQIVALRDFCKEQNYTDITIYNDAGISARKRYTRRPALLQLIEDIKANKIDLILFTRLDRWFRSVSDYYEVQRILDEYSVPWRAIWEDYETETSAGVFKVNIMLSVAQSEADRTSERIKSVNEYKRAQGYYVGSAPIGYKVKGKNLVIDDSCKDGITALFSTYLQTYSISKALQSAKKNGLRIDRRHALKIVRNPAYCGETRSGYVCEPYISKTDYDNIMEHFKRNPRPPRTTKRVYLFSGLVFCGNCGARMAGKTVIRTHADGSKAEHIKYVCDRASTRIEQHHLQIVEYQLEDYLLKNVEVLLEQHRATISLRNDQEGINGRLNYLNGKLERLKLLFQEGDLDIDIYRSKRDDIKREIETIASQEVGEPIQLPDTWREIYDDMSREGKKIFWASCIDKIIINPDNKVNPTVSLKGHTACAIEILRDKVKAPKP